MKLKLTISFFLLLCITSIYVLGIITGIRVVLYLTSTINTKTTLNSQERASTTVTRESFMIYPAKGATIKDPNPTISGKLFQDKGLIIEPEFVYEAIPYNTSEKAYFLKFDYENLKNTAITLDNMNLETINMLGIPQYPTLLCTSNTKEACLKEYEGKYPPVLFYFNVTNPLTKGLHKLSIAYKSGTIESYFWYDSQLQYNKANLPTYELNFEKQKNQIIQPPESLTKEDDCFSGYYYSKNFLHVPAPDTKLTSYFSLSLPNNARGSGIKDGKVSIKFNETNYKFFMSSFDTFFGQETNGKDYLNSPYFYIPTELLYYSNGQQAKVYVKDDGYYSYETFYLIPEDAPENDYELNALPWATMSWSGCDG